MTDDIDEIIDDGFRALDWSVLDELGVTELAQQVAASVARGSSSVHLDADDLFQEASILLAKNAGVARGLLRTGEEPSDGLSALRTWVYNRLRNKARVEVTRQSKAVPMSDVVARQARREEVA